jgi:hypothetical protein
MAGEASSPAPSWKRPSGRPTSISHAPGWFAWRTRTTAAHADYIHFDGGCGLTAGGIRATDCLLPALTAQDEIFTDLGFYWADWMLQPFVRFEWNGFVDDVDHGKGSRRYMGGFNYYVAQQNLKITAAFERIVPNAPGAADWKQKNRNHFVLQLQFFYF